MAEPRKSFALRISGPLFEELKRWAEQDMRSMNGQIEFLLHQAVQRRGRPLPTDGGDAEAGDTDKAGDAPPDDDPASSGGCAD